jgi:acetylglutamate kinase
MNLWVIKVGGNVLDDTAALAQLLDTLAAATEPWVLVHGGGKLATELATKLGIETTMIEGRRVTDAESLCVAVMVYAGWINKTLVAALQSKGVNTVGLTGADGNLVRAERRSPVPVDYGYVGDPVAVKTGIIEQLLSAGQRAVVAPLTHDGAGQLLNTNADTLAQALAVGLAATHEVHLVYCFEKAGVLLDASDDASVIAEISPARFAELKASGAVNGGMIPKLTNAFAALGSGVTTVRILQSSSLAIALDGGQAGTTLRA